LLKIFGTNPLKKFLFGRKKLLFFFEKKVTNLPVVVGREVRWEMT
jgi:hypothetical protein